MSEKKVSIIVPVKNRPDLIRETLQSVQAQTYPYWEAVVVDDRSTDETTEVVAAMAAEDERIRYFQRPEGKGGAPVCRNIGIQKAHGEYIIYLDSDDLLARECLQYRLEFMEDHPELDFGVFQGEIFYEEPGDTNRIYNLASIEDDLNRFLQYDFVWQTTGPIYTREAVEMIGEWDEKLPGGQDLDYQMRSLIQDLEYSCENRVDYYIRGSTEDRKQISANKWQPRRLDAYLYRMKKIYRLLEQNSGLTQKRKRLLAGNIFHIARRWLRLDQSKKAHASWANTWNNGLIGPFRYYLVKFYLGVHNTPLAPFLAYYMYQTWPEAFFVLTRLQSGRYTKDQEPGIHEVPVTDGQHPFRSYARLFQQGPASFMMGYAQRRIKAAFQCVGLVR